MTLSHPISVGEAAEAVAAMIRATGVLRNANAPLVSN